MFGWGGSRENAGRPATGRSKVNFYITQEESEYLRLALDAKRTDSRDSAIKTVACHFGQLINQGQLKQALRYLGFVMGRNNIFLDTADVDYVFKHLCETTNNTDIYHNHHRINE